jgi:hypothetical protein
MIDERQALFEVCVVEPCIPSGARALSSLPCAEYGETTVTTVTTVETRTPQFQRRVSCVPSFTALKRPV